jgi:hypothetical protein
MSRYTIPAAPTTPPALSIARSLLLHAQRAANERVNEHRQRFHDFWDSPVPPAEIAAELGTNGVEFLADANESIRHIMTLVCGPAIEQMTEQERLDALHTVLPPEHYMPRLPLVPNEDGTITVQPVDGLDEWGRPIPEPEPEPEPEP